MRFTKEGELPALARWTSDDMHRIQWLVAAHAKANAWRVWPASRDVACFFPPGLCMVAGLRIENNVSVRTVVHIGQPCQKAISIWHWSNEITVGQRKVAPRIGARKPKSSAAGKWLSIARCCPLAARRGQWRRSQPSRSGIMTPGPATWRARPWKVVLHDIETAVRNVHCKV